MSLVDLVVGLAALIPVIMVVAGLFPVAHLLGKRAWGLGTAQQLAAAQLEQLRAQPFDRLPALTNTDFQQRGVTFHCSVRVDTPTGLPPTVKRAVVAVQWHLRQNESFQVVTYLTRTAI